MKTSAVFREKPCLRCGGNLFYKGIQKKKYVRWQCKSCQNKSTYLRAQLPKNREKERLRSVERYRDNREKMCLTRIKSRAKVFGLQFSLSTYPFTPDECPVLSLPLDKVAKGKCNPNAPSVDRIDNSIGYVEGNVRVISNRANSIKRDATFDELNRVTNYVAEHEAKKWIWDRVALLSPPDPMDYP